MCIACVLCIAYRMCIAQSWEKWEDVRCSTFLGRRHSSRWTHSPQTRSLNKVAVFWSYFRDFVGTQKIEDSTESKNSFAEVFQITSRLVLVKNKFGGSVHFNMLCLLMFVFTPSPLQTDQTELLSNNEIVFYNHPSLELIHIPQVLKSNLPNEWRLQCFCLYLRFWFSWLSCGEIYQNFLSTLHPPT